MFYSILCCWCFEVFIPVGIAFCFDERQSFKFLTGVSEKKKKREKIKDFYPWKYVRLTVADFVKYVLSGKPNAACKYACYVVWNVLESMIIMEDWLK